MAPAALFILLGIVLLFSALQQVLRLGEELPPVGDASAVAARLRLVGTYPDARLGRDVPYAAQRVPLGFAMMAGAGRGVGPARASAPGALKVLAMDGAMRLPMKVCSATSNFMIGVTAAASAGIYLGRGDVDPTIAAPVALGVLAGATLGARILPRLSNRSVRLVFLPVLLVVGLETLARGPGARTVNPERFRILVSARPDRRASTPSAALIAPRLRRIAVVGWERVARRGRRSGTDAATDFSALGSNLVARCAPSASPRLGLVVLWPPRWSGSRRPSWPLHARGRPPLRGDHARRALASC